MCGIKILEMQDYHGEEDDLNSEEWKVLLTFSHGGIHGQESLNKIEVGIHIKDENILRPQLQDWFGLQPVHYQLNIIPDLLMNNQTISFAGEVDVRNNIYMIQLLIQFHIQPRLNYLSPPGQASSLGSTCSP